ncbi:uncharacterized protein LOC135836424 isoform X1 [Planococcus citri]|uniref:uncharacterized protein LOC135836424 isoform X1 n=1 Tax=Planococcus citri TaxID=170843 RepID=UPI0031F7DDA9
MASVIQEEYPFRFINSPSSLQSLAATGLSLDYWRHQYFSHPPKQDDPITSFLEKKNTSCDEIFTVPSCIKNLIDDRIKSVGPELKKWIKYLSIEELLFEGTIENALPRFLNCTVMKPSGTVSFTATATNVLKSDKFSDVEKYLIATTFCLEEEVKRIWPLVSDAPRVKVGTTMKSHMMFYFNRRMMSRKAPISIVNQFKESYTKKNWAACEYFFDQLSDKEKITRIKIIVNGKDAEAIMCLLPKLTRDMAETVFKATNSRLLHVLATETKYSGYVCESFAVFKNFIFETPSMFSNMISKLWAVVFISKDLDFDRRHRVNAFLFELWTSAPRELKLYVVTTRFNEFFCRLKLGPDSFSQCYGHDMAFMLELFNIASFERRNEIWKRNWRKIAFHATPKFFKQFMRLALQNDEDINVYKERLFKHTDLFKSLIEAGFFSDLTDYLNVCSNDPTLIRNCSQRLLKSNADVMFYYDKDRCARCDVFLGALFSNVKNDVDQFKFRMICCRTQIKKLHSEFNRDDSLNIQQAVDFFISSPEQLKELKRKFLSHLRSSVVPSPFYRDEFSPWSQLVEWCIDNAKQLSEFKRTFNIDEIFLKCIEGRGRWGKIQYFNEFSKWFFETDEARIAFRTNKIHNYHKIDELNKILRSAESSVDEFLSGIFDGDMSEVRKFQQFFKRNEHALSSTRNEEFSDAELSSDSELSGIRSFDTSLSSAESECSDTESPSPESHNRCRISL